MQETINEKDFLKTLAKGLEVIKSFDRQHSKMTLSELAKKNDLSRASARRFLLTLQSLGYIEKEKDQFYLKAKILELGYQYLSNLDFIEILLPIMKEVSKNLGKACSAAVLDGTEIVYVARIPSQQQILSVNLNIGSRLPAYCTSMGRALLSGHSSNEIRDILSKMDLKSYTRNTVVDPEELLNIILKVKQDGYSIVDQELEESLCSISKPIHNEYGSIVCAINVGIPVGLVKMNEVLHTYLPVLEEAVIQAETALAHHPGI